MNGLMEMTENDTKWTFQRIMIQVKLQARKLFGVSSDFPTLHYPSESGSMRSQAGTLLQYDRISKVLRCVLMYLPDLGQCSLQNYFVCACLRIHTGYCGTVRNRLVQDILDPFFERI